MNNFEWSFDTKVIFGQNSESKIGNECIKYGKKALVVRSNGAHI